ncbi:MAG: hypothetical protein HC878_15670 [Leptolyngbyaceae cyanobacterium SL_5_14]|nr:hypothetical protein [Leptolyngbyaceae cyanobacterium SL_5_14]
MSIDDKSIVDRRRFTVIGRSQIKIPSIKVAEGRSPFTPSEATAPLIYLKGTIALLR